MAADVKVEDAHEFVYHYTTLHGLEGILRSQCLHATHYKYLNDQSELAMLRPKLQADFEPHIREFSGRFAQAHPRFQREIVDAGQLDDFIVGECITAARVLYDVTLGIGRDRKYFDPYIISFCSHSDVYEKRNGLLSQWRGYGSGGGYALVLKTSSLVESFKWEGERAAFTSGFFGDVVYDDDPETFEREFGDLAGLIWRDLEKVIFHSGSLSDDVFRRFVNAVARFKHRGFKEEREVRAVFSVLSESEREQYKHADQAAYDTVAKKSIKDVHFRAGFVPYISLLESDGKLPIEMIIVGPHKDKMQRKEYLDAYLKSANLRIETSVSETPFI